MNTLIDNVATVPIAAGAALSFTESGTPGQPTLVFLHGLGMGQWMWQDQVNAFQDYHVLNLDLPGHGGSSTLTWQSFPHTAALVAQTIERHATDGKAHVIGLSLGGITALHLLARYPARVGRAVISGAIAEPPKPAWAFRLQGQVMNRLLRTRVGVSAFAALLHIPPDAETRRTFAATIAQMRKETFIQVSRELAAFTLPETVKDIPTPTLFVTGDKDLGINHRSARILAHILPNAVGVYAPEGHHGWNGELPELFNAMTRAWIEQQPLPAALIRAV